MVLCTSVIVLPVVIIVNWMVWFHDATVWFDGLNFCYTYVTDVMTHKYNTQTKKEAVVSNEALDKVEESISST